MEHHDGPVTDLDSAAAEYDRAVAQTRGISAYCSCSDWAFSAAELLHPGRTPVVVRRAGHWVALTLGTHEDVGPYLQPLEADWGFSAPLLGPKSAESVGLLTDVLRSTAKWRVALLTGLPLETATTAALALNTRYRVVVRDGIRCQVALLDGGLDAYLSRRSARLRRNLRRDARRARSAGVTFDHVRDSGTGGRARPLMQRILDVERRSWKCDAGQSVLHSPRYFGFYSSMVARASAHGRLRAVIAQLDGRDVAYCFGGVFGASYRGFQLGYAEDVADLGLGNQTQLAMIEELASEGVTTYDLGMEMGYKVRWSEAGLPLYTVVIVRTRG